MVINPKSRLRCRGIGQLGRVFQYNIDLKRRKLEIQWTNYDFLYEIT